MELTPLGKTIRDLRTKKSLLLKQMADALGLTSVQMSDLEFGQIPLLPDMVQNIVAYFKEQGASEDELLALKQSAQRSYGILKSVRLKDKGMLSVETLREKLQQNKL